MRGYHSWVSPCLFGTIVLIGLEKSEYYQWFLESGQFIFRLHPYRMHPEYEGLSHGLQNSPPDCFVPSLRSGRPFESLGV